MKVRRRRVETVRVGNVRVKIYRRIRTVAGHRYPTFEVCDYTSGTRNVHRQILWRLFAHYEARGYIQRGTNPVAGTQTFSRKRAEAIEIWTPAEMAKLLVSADQTFLPILAIGAFAGLRTSEILALDWRDVRLKERVIKVVHRKTRCAGTRLAPIPENLFAWLSPLTKKTGPVWPRGVEWKERERTMTAAQNATVGAAGPLPWRHNSIMPSSA